MADYFFQTDKPFLGVSEPRVTSRNAYSEMN